MGTRWLHNYIYYTVVKLHSTVLTVLVLNLRPNGYALGSYTVIELRNTMLSVLNPRPNGYALGSYTVIELHTTMGTEPSTQWVRVGFIYRSKVA